MYEELPQPLPPSIDSLSLSDADAIIKLSSWLRTRLLLWPGRGVVPREEIYDTDLADLFTEDVARSLQCQGLLSRCFYYPVQFWEVSPAVHALATHLMAQREPDPFLSPAELQRLHPHLTLPAVRERLRRYRGRHPHEVHQTWEDAPNGGGTRPGFRYRKSLAARLLGV